MLNLDTHILIFALSGDLRPREKKLLANHPWSISAIVLWELSKLVQLNRIDLDLEDSEVLSTLSRIHVWPLSLDICRVSNRLDIKSDPADEIIGATSIVHRVRLLTRDRKLLASKLIPIA